MATTNKQRVGDELQARRQELGYSLHKVEVATKIRGRYLRAIEASDFANLPNDVYSRGFVRQYANYVKLPGAEFAKRYQEERGNPIKQSKQGKPRAMDLRLGATSRWVASLAALGAVAVVAGYLLWQFSSLTAAPKLDVDSPAKDSVVEASSVEVKGTAAAGSDVFLNDVPLPSDVNGVFKTTLILQPGINEVRIVAKNKLGKETKLTRNILSKQTISDQLPTATFDGVAVLLSAGDSSAVTIVADGNTVYEGNIARGSARLISAKNTITVMTSNAASLSAQLTNSAVAGYDFGVFGTNQADRTIEFTKTTQVSQ
jgi:cytoskeletal protein RodZ